MAQEPHIHTRTLPELFKYFLLILGPEKKYYVLAIVYAIGISLLSLATPISVQMLINTVANTGLTTPLIVLTATLFMLLLVSGLLQALRIHLMDLFGRRFYARMVSDIALRTIYARNPFFNDSNMAPLFNRYFDIIIVQKRLPVLFVSGFTIVMQTVAGIILVSFYHPYLLIFNLVVSFLVYLVWAIWGKRAIVSSMEASHKKHAAAAWLEELGSSNGFFKTSRTIADALHKTDEATGAFMRRHIIHFRHHFSQTLCFLFIYAAASASLLGLGGWLVIQNELSLGQLVAAELVLSVVFYGISQLGTYLTYFYDLCAAVEELSLFHDIEQDPPLAHQQPFNGDSSLSFASAKGESRGTMLTLNLDIKAGSRVLAATDNQAAQRIFVDFLKSNETPRSGYIAIGGQDFQSFQNYQIRQEVMVLDRPSVIECTIRDYLYFSSQDEVNEDILGVLKTVGLEPVLAQLPDGIDTVVAPTGWPLSITETMQLKLAAVMIAKPRVVVLSQLFDVMPDLSILSSLEYLSMHSDMTVVYFSNRHTDLGFDRYLYLGLEQQTLFDRYEDMCAAAGLPVQPLTPVAPRSPTTEVSK